VPPGAFALVMATGIVSVAAAQEGRPALSWTLFALGAVAFVLCVCCDLFVPRAARK